MPPQGRTGRLARMPEHRARDRRLSPIAARAVRRAMVSNARWLLIAAALGLFVPPAAAAPLSANLGLRIDGRLWRQHAGIFAAGAGDVNGDGLADILVGTAETHRARGARWNAYIVFG